MNCDEVRRMLDAYLDGELDLTRQLDVETHLPGCATCKDAAEDITKVCSLVQRISCFQSTARPRKCPLDAPIALKPLWNQLIQRTSSDECASLQRASRA
jgi:anti-sigma factor RsiW